MPLGGLNHGWKRNLLYPDWRTKEQTRRSQTPYQTICWQMLSGSLISTHLAAPNCWRNQWEEHKKKHSEAMRSGTRSRWVYNPCHQKKL